MGSNSILYTGRGNPPVAPNNLSNSYGYGDGGYGEGGYGYGSGSASTGPIYKLPLAYYISLFTSQWQNSPIFLNWAGLAWQPLDDLTTLLSQLSQSFILATATGAQLDIMGQIIGVSRTVPFQPSDSVSPILDDNTYRTLLTATIYKYKWNGKIGSLYGIWKQIFPAGELVINDNQNMSATILISGTFTSIVQDLITNGYIVPRPEGVLYNYVFAELPAFGTDLDTGYIAGVDVGHIT